MPLAGLGSGGDAAGAAGSKAAEGATAMSAPGGAQLSLRCGQLMLSAEVCCSPHIPMRACLQLQVNKLVVLTHAEDGFLPASLQSRAYA